MTAQPSLPHRQALSSYLDQLHDRVVQKLRSEASSAENKTELLKTLGFRDETLLDELGSIGITSDGLIALRLYPLVHVAWSGGNVDPSEASSVMAQARSLGIAEGSAAEAVLEEWLRHRPPMQAFDAWVRYTRGVLSQLSGRAIAKFIRGTEHQLRSIATASGGVLGIGKVSETEAAAIDRIRRDA